MMKRIEMNDPIALSQEGLHQYETGDYISAFEYYSKAAKLGDAEAHYQLSLLYSDGHGVEKDKRKEIHHLEKAAIGGHPEARHNLGCREWDSNDNAERAVKHWIIAATQGVDESIEALMHAFQKGFVRKVDLASTLRSHRAAVDSMKSTQRRDAAKAYRSEFLRSW